jgi:hypothetical protein
MEQKDIKRLQEIYLRLLDLCDFALDLAQDMRFIYDMQDYARDPKTNYIQSRHVGASYEIVNQLSDITRDIGIMLYEKGVDTDSLLDQHYDMSVCVIGNGVQSMHWKFEDGELKVKNEYPKKE